MTYARVSRRAGALAAIMTIGALVFAANASAHVEVQPGEVVAGSTTSITLEVGHGCDGSPTRRLDIQIPVGVKDVVGSAPVGWTALSSATVLTFTSSAGAELAPDATGKFPFSFVAPTQPGRVFFKTVQKCTEGETAWIDAWDGTGAEPDNPAPSVMVVADPNAETPGDGGAGAPTTSSAAPATTTTVAAAPTTAIGSQAEAPATDDETDDESDGTNWPLVIGLVAVAVVIAGAVAAAVARKNNDDAEAGDGHNGDAQHKDQSGPSDNS